jgi:hypothetical protein
MAALIFETPAAMANDLGRRLEHPPAHGPHLRALPFPAERDAAKARIQIVGRHTDGEERGVGLECAARHVFHAETDLQILDTILAGVAALAILFHRRRRFFVRAIAGNDVTAIERLVLEQILLARAAHPIADFGLRQAS